jgi:hypothetical protein
LTAYDASVSKQ